jgi:hypothetical protein
LICHSFVQAYAQLAQACWLEDPAARPTFTKIVQELEQMLAQSAALQREADLAWTDISGFWAED